MADVANQVSGDSPSDSVTKEDKAAAIMATIDGLREAGFETDETFDTLLKASIVVAQVMSTGTREWFMGLCAKEWDNLSDKRAAREASGQ